MSGVFLDTNVVLYLLSEDARKANIAEAILAKGGTICVQVLNEAASVCIPPLQFDLRLFASGSYLVGNTTLLQAHTTLDKAVACVLHNCSYNYFYRSNICDIMLTSLLFGTYRQRVLGLLLLNPERSYYVREIARLTATAAGTLHKELARLAGAGLLVRESVGNQVRYSANRECPVFEELASILRKTSGLVDVLAEALSPVENQISLAFVFGSLARGEQQSSSDVDVILVGSMGFADAVRVLHPVQETLQREINPVVYSLDEFHRRTTSGDSFIREVLSKPKLFIVGNEDELRKLTQDQAATTA